MNFLHIYKLEVLLTYQKRYTIFLHEVNVHLNKLCKNDHNMFYNEVQLNTLNNIMRLLVKLNNSLNFSEIKQ